MEITTVDIEEILNLFDSGEMDVDIEKFVDKIKAPPLKNLETMLEERKFEEAFQFVSQINQTYLWELLARSALLNFDFVNAERAFVECSSFEGLQFSRRIQFLDNKALQAAETYAFFHMFKEARDILIKAERKDLAIQLLAKIGDYEKIMELIVEGSGSDALLLKTYDQLGEYF